MKRNISRRQLLRTGAVVGSLGVVAPKVSATSSDSTLRLRADVTDPIQWETIDKQRHEVIKQWTNQWGRRNDAERLVTVTKPDLTRKDIFAYNFELTEDGTPVEFYGTSQWSFDFKIASESTNEARTTDEEVAELHELADEHATVSKAGQDSGSSHSTSGNYTDAEGPPNDVDLEDFETVSDTTEWTVDKPKGKTRHEFINYYSPFSSHYVLYNEEDLKPGAMLGWGNNCNPFNDVGFKNDNGRILHDWAPNRTKYDNRFPEGTQSGEVGGSVGVTVGGTTEGDLSGSFTATYTYQQSSQTLIDRSDGQNHHMDWTMDVSGTGPDRASTVVFSPVSVFLLTDPPNYPNRPERTVRATNKGTFINEGCDVGFWTSPASETLSTTMDFYTHTL